MVGHRHRRQAGFGIVQLLLLATAVLGIAAYALSVMQRQSKQSAGRRQNSKYQLFVDHLRAQLNDAQICTTALGGKTLALAITSPPTWSPVSLDLSYGSDPGPLAAGWKGKESGYALRTVEVMVQEEARYVDANGNQQVRHVSYDWPRESAVSPNSFRKFYGALRISADDAFWNVENDEGWIKLSLVVDAAGKVRTCFGRFSAAEACESNGGAYDVTAGSEAGERCNPDIYCFNHSVGLVSDPGACQYPYVTNPMGYVDGGLKYLCTWCNRNH